MSIRRWYTREIDSAFWKRWWNSRAEEISSGFELDRVSSLWDKELEEISNKKLFDFIEPRADDFIFDAGCGSGANISMLRSKVTGIVGMDFSEAMIDRCRKRIEEENICSMGLAVGNISHVGLKGNTFNKIICLSVLHYMNDEECKAALKELVRISKEGAILILHVKNLSSLCLSTRQLAKRIKRWFTRKVVMEHYRTYRWYRRELSELGGEIVGYDSSNMFVLDFLPKCLYQQLRRVEMKHYKGKFLRKYGADLKLKVKIRKTKDLMSRE